MKRFFTKSGMFTLISLVLIVSLVGVRPAYAAPGNAASELGPARSDHTPPPAPIVNAPPRLTNDTTPVIGGIAQEDTKVNVWYIDDQGNRIQICRNVQVDDDEIAGPHHREKEFEPWSCTSSVVLPEGEITLVVNATDKSGNTSEDTIYIFTIGTDDTTPPAAPVVTSPVGTTNDTTPTITGTAEPGSTVNVWYLDNLGNRVPICQDILVDSSGNWSCTSSVTLPEAEITLVVNATDPAGNTSLDTNYVFTIGTDTTPPAAPVVTSPVGTTNDTTPTITGTAEPGSLVNVSYLDDLGNPVPICQDVLVDSSGNWSCTSSVTLPERDIEIVVNATDPAGNTSTDASFFFTVDTTFVDTIPPTVSSLVRADPNPSTDPTVDYILTFSEPVTGVDAGDFALQVTGTITGADIANITGSGATYTVTVDTGSGTGTLNLTIPVTATVTDLAGNPLAGLPYSSGEVYTIGTGPIYEAVTVGVFRTVDVAWHLRNSNTSGAPDISTNYGMPVDYPVVGDWDGNGTDTIGIFRNGVFYLSNSNTSSVADIVFAFGMPGDQPIAGDWDGDGIDTIGLYRSSAITFYLRNDNSTGAPDMSLAFGNPGDVGVAGDWDGDGQDSIGVFRPLNGTLFLKNSNTAGFADLAITYGLPGDKPVLGDWNSDGIDTIGVYRNNTFYLRNSNATGFADFVVNLTTPGDLPVAGNWDGLP